MSKILHILLVFLFSFTIFSCSEKEEHTTDTTAPVIAEVTAVTTPTTDTTPDYTFSSSEAGTITYGGSCSSSTTSATSGNNTITLVSLSDGTFSDCTIKVTDSAGNVSNLLTITTFVINAFSGNNNYSTLTGNNIGYGSTSISELSKSVTLTLQTSHSDISLGTAYVGRGSNTSGFMYWIIPVTNNSISNDYCFVNLKTVSFYDSSDSLLTTADTAGYVDGSVGKKSGNYTNTCLTYNEQGFVSGIKNVTNLYTNISKIVISSIDLDSVGYFDPELKVIPQSYQTSGSDNELITVSVTNQTGVKTNIGSFSMIYLLDSNNNPVSWDYIDSSGVV